jgi:hypothetical protein
MNCGSSAAIIEYPARPRISAAQIEATIAGEGAAGLELIELMGEILALPAYESPIHGVSAKGRKNSRILALAKQEDRAREEPPLAIGRHNGSRRQPRERYLSPPNGFIVVLSLSSARGSILETRRVPSCCS